jgi:hypothetical protein
MNRLLKLTAIIEAVTGLALIAAPTVIVRLLLLAGDIFGADIPLGRVAILACSRWGSHAEFQKGPMRSFDRKNAKQLQSAIFPLGHSLS